VGEVLFVWNGLGYANLFPSANVSRCKRVNPTNSELELAVTASVHFSTLHETPVQKILKQVTSVAGSDKR
jgi:hypothetical protein